MDSLTASTALFKIAMPVIPFRTHKHLHICVCVCVQVSLIINSPFKPFHFTLQAKLAAPQ